MGNSPILSHSFDAYVLVKCCCGWSGVMSLQRRVMLIRLLLEAGKLQLSGVIGEQRGKNFLEYW